jgi:uncharacterized protein involved in exopolysaccharide biosynthesis
MQSVWKGGRSSGLGLLNGDSEGRDGDDDNNNNNNNNNNLSGINEPFEDDDTSVQQQKRGVAVKLAPLNHNLPAERVQFEDRMQYLTEEFEAFKATLQADYEDHEETKKKQKGAVERLRNEIEVERRQTHELEVQLEDVQNEAMMWKLKYEKLKVVMRGAIEEAE